MPHTTWKDSRALRYRLMSVSAAATCFGILLGLTDALVAIAVLVLGLLIVSVADRGRFPIRAVRHS